MCIVQTSHKLCKLLLIVHMTVVQRGGGLIQVSWADFRMAYLLVAVSKIGQNSVNDIYSFFFCRWWSQIFPSGRWSKVMARGTNNSKSTEGHIWHVKTLYKDDFRRKSRFWTSNPYISCEFATFWPKYGSKWRDRGALSHGRVKNVFWKRACHTKSLFQSSKK